jgi:putative endonuclease
MTQKSDFGRYCEHLASQFLQRKGYEIMELNFRRKWGEIDVVARKEGIFVFIEVKASRSSIAGFEPELRAGRDKMKKVHRTARTYLAYRKIGPEIPWQIDIISVTFNKEKTSANIKHFKNIDF